MRTTYKAILLTLILCIISPVLGYQVSAEDNILIKVYINEEQVNFDKQPLMIQDTTMVPFRALFEKLGVSIVWNPLLQEIIGTRDELTIRLTVGKSDAFVNGKLTKLNVPAQLIDGSTYVPLRFIGEALDSEVNWDSGKRSIFIATKVPVTIKDISVGYDHTLALMSNGTVKAWGNNDYGQLAVIDRIEPSFAQLEVKGLDKVIAIAAGYKYSLALKSDGTVLQWGSTLGESEDYVYPSPTKINDLQDVIQIYSSFSRSYAVKGDGTLWAWGDGNIGALGEGGRFVTVQPIQILGMENVANIAIGVSSTTLLKTDGTVWTWGSNMFGELGNGETGFGIGDQSKDVLIPFQLKELNHITQISSGYSHTLALSSEGKVWTWGENSYGQLGNGGTENQLIPIELKVSWPVKIVVASRTHSYILNQNGDISGWGDNLRGALGNGTFKPANSPQLIVNQNNIIAIRSSEQQIFTFSANGQIWTWGDNSYGQLGINQYESVYLSPQLMSVSNSNRNESEESSIAMVTDYHEIVEAGKMYVRESLDKMETTFAQGGLDLQNEIVEITVEDIRADSSGGIVTLILEVESIATTDSGRTQFIQEFNCEVSEEVGTWKVTKENSVMKLSQKWL